MGLDALYGGDVRQQAISPVAHRIQFEPRDISRAGDAAVEALNKGAADAALLVGGSDAPSVENLLNNPRVRLMNFSSADAFMRVFPDLVRLVLPKGVVQFDPPNPPDDITLVAAGIAMGLQIRVFDVDTIDDINLAFATIALERPDAIFVGVTPFLNSRRVQITQLAFSASRPLFDFNGEANNVSKNHNSAIIVR